MTSPSSPSPASTLPLLCLFPCLLLLLLLHPFPAIANLHNLKPKPLPTHPPNSPNPTQFFEVTKPISVPNTIPCIHHVFSHDFASTLSKPPVLTPYTPPSHCPPSHGGFSKIILEWNATCQGRQFDRIFGLWLAGVELLRSCTAEPRPDPGILWSVRKDVTKYSSALLSRRGPPQDLAVFLGNIVDDTYTGIYHVNVSIYFYPAASSSGKSQTHGSSKSADLILPISRNVANLTDGLWFEIENSTTRAESNRFAIPSNAYRVVLEVYVSPHGDDEFWYTNYPNDYIVANNMTSTTTLGNGPFREVVVSLDDVTMGAVWPFTVIYTGGINPLLWRPISGIGSFDLPTYDIEMTPFLGRLLDGKEHRFGFSVTNGLKVWFVDANLHLWLDRAGVKKTEGKLVSHSSELGLTSHANFKGLNGKFETGASRWVLTEGWVKSSYGNVTCKFSQRFSYSNAMEIGKEGGSQRVNQRCNSNDTVSFSGGGLFRSTSKFSVELDTDSKEGRNNTVSYETRLALGVSSRRFRDRREVSRLGNLQTARGEMVVQGNLVTGGFGATKQLYKYAGEEEEDDGSSKKSCYFRDVGSKNYTIVHDRQGNECHR